MQLDNIEQIAMKMPIFKMEKEKKIKKHGQEVVSVVMPPCEKSNKVSTDLPQTDLIQLHLPQNFHQGINSPEIFTLSETSFDVPDSEEENDDVK